jgi:hypothetical protein
MEVSKSIGLRTISGCEILSSDGFLNDDLPRLFVNHYLVAAANIKLFAQRFWDCDLATVTNASFFHVAHTYSY